MAGGCFPKVPALRAARFASCCTAPLCSLIYHCVHLLSLLSLSLCLASPSFTALLPCPSVLRRPEAGAGRLFSSLRDSRICTILICVVFSARRQWPRQWLRSVAWPHGPFYSFQNSRTFMSNTRFVATWSSNTRAGSARLSRCHFVSPVEVAVLLHQRLH